nr:unnamed protein product [Callosobruchus analis]
MAQINAEVEDSNIQYVIKDTSEFVLQSSDSDQFGNLMCTDGTQAFFLDGALIADSSNGNGQTYILQDSDLGQYYIQESDGIVVSEENKLSGTDFLEAVPSLSGEQDSSSQTPLIQFIDDEGNLVNAQIPSILYIQDETETGQYQLVQDLQAEADGMQAIQLETNQVVELKDLIQQQEETTVQIEGDENRYQYVILKDGNLHIQSYPKYEDNDNIDKVVYDAPKEWENITGRNLITGKQLSLQSLVENQRKLGSPKRKRKKKGGLEELLNKKLNLGRTVDGKKLVGKIIHIGKRKQKDEAVIKDAKQENETTNSVEPTLTEVIKDGASFDDTNLLQATFVEANSTQDGTIDSNGFETTNVVQTISRKRVSTASEIEFILKRKVICNDVLEQISKTLIGLMRLESVSKRLKNKHLLIKVVEQKYVQSKKIYERNFSYSSGYMVEICSIDQETGDLMESWSYEHEGGIKEHPDAETLKKVMFKEVLRLTFVITLLKDGPHVKVVMEPDDSLFRCRACDKTFKTKTQLDLHLSTLHSISLQMKQCDHCPFATASDAEWEDHRKYHDGQHVLGCIEPGCEATFSTLEKLSIHHAEVHKKVNKDSSKCSSGPDGNDNDSFNNQISSHGMKSNVF